MAETISLDKSEHDRFHSFCIRPGIRFESQAENEEIILMLRAHPITQLPWILNSIFSLILLVFFDFFTRSFFTGPQLIVINTYVIVFTFAYAYLNVLNYFFNVGIVTNMRIVDIDFHSVIYKEVTATKLDKIEDTTSKASGYFSSFFNYGDLFVQTAGKEANIEFPNVPDPQRATKIINELIHRD